MRSKVLLGSLVFCLIGVLVGFCCFKTAEAAQDPKNLNIGIITITVLEEPWNTMFIQSLERVKAEKPHGLELEWDISENVYPPDAERVLKTYAKTGKYDILWGHSSYGDTIKKLSREFPDILWAIGGDGNEPAGGNAYWVNVEVGEPAYLIGMLAGMMTKSNILGVVASYPYPNINFPVNGFKFGAKAVNPDVRVIITFIESWFDPPKAKQAALAQIAAGADMIFAERFGPFEACKEKKVLGFGNYVDQNDLASEVVLSSTIGKFDPIIDFMVDRWWDHQTKGTPYDAPMEKVEFRMKEGSGDIAPYHQLASRVPDDVKKKIEETRKQMLDGTLQVPRSPKPPVSD